MHVERNTRIAVMRALSIASTSGTVADIQSCSLRSRTQGEETMREGEEGTGRGGNRDVPGTGDSRC